MLLYLLLLRWKLLVVLPAPFGSGLHVFVHFNDGGVVQYPAWRVVATEEGGGLVIVDDMGNVGIILGVLDSVVRFVDCDEVLLGDCIGG